MAKEMEPGNMCISVKHFPMTVNMLVIDGQSAWEQIQKLRSNF